MDTSSDVVAHSGELSVKCGEETIVMKCEHGSWDQALVFCPGKCEHGSWDQALVFCPGKIKDF